MAFFFRSFRTLGQLVVLNFVIFFLRLSFKLSIKSELQSSNLPAILFVFCLETQPVNHFNFTVLHYQLHLLHC